MMSQKQARVGVSKGREYWLEVVNRYRSSGLVQKDFCAREGVSLGSFKGWFYRIRSEEAQNLSCDHSLFTRIVVDEESIDPVPQLPCQTSLESPLILELSDKMRIVVASGFGAQTLRRLLDVVTQDV